MFKPIIYFRFIQRITTIFLELIAYTNFFMFIFRDRRERIKNFMAKTNPIRKNRESI